MSDTLARENEAIDVLKETGENMKPVAIANFFLKKAADENIPITQLKLLKLVYFGYGWVAAILDQKLFDERVEAWKHGPVVSSLYHEFKHFGNKPIPEMGVSYDLDTGLTTIPEIPESEEDIRLVLTFVWDIYKRYSAWALRGKTHEVDTPWFRAEKKGDFFIGFEDIKEHFHKRVTEYLE